VALKDNHPQLSEEVRLGLDTQVQAEQLSPMETIEKDQGRLESRHYFLGNPREWLAERAEWRGRCAVGMVEATPDTGSQVRVARGYFLGSFDELDHVAGVVRAPWSIENSQHGVLAVQFGEDRNRTRTDQAPENLALARRTALDLIRQNGNPKESLKRRRLRASLNDDYRWQLLAGQQA
jgi:predicted transposase YbfD/YdcC